MRRIPELDALRGLAALAIVVFHLWFPTSSSLGTSVYLFFVISGYLITAIILRHGGGGPFLPAFYARRLLRIWPAYYLALLAVVALNALLKDPTPLEGLPYFLTFTQSVSLYVSPYEPLFPAGFQHTWTLAIEEQFYLVWPALVLLAGRKRLAALSLSCVGLCVIVRASGMSRFVLLTECDGLALGGLLAAWLSDAEAIARRRTAYRLGFALATLSGIAMVAATKGGASAPSALVASIRALGMNVIYAGMVGAVICEAGQGITKGLRLRPLVYLGSISYGIYLYHYIIQHAAAELLADRGVTLGPWFNAATFVASLLAAVASWEFFEKPILALKDRFAYDAPARQKEPEVKAPAGLGMESRP